MEENVKILLCEDDENLGMLLREYLQAKGFTTELCPDGEAGFRAFQRDKFCHLFSRKVIIYRKIKVYSTGVSKPNL